LHRHGVRRKEEPRSLRPKTTMKLLFSNLVKNLMDRIGTYDYTFLCNKYSSLESFMTLYNQLHFYFQGGKEGNLSYLPCLLPLFNFMWIHGNIRIFKGCYELWFLKSSKYRYILRRFDYAIGWEGV
jgi:hypothetical protein